GILRSGHELLMQHAYHFEPRIVDLDELAEGGAVAEQVDLGGFAEHADGGAGGVVGLVEEFALGQMQAVDSAVSRPNAVELGDVARRLGENASGVQGTPGG